MGSELKVGFTGTRTGMVPLQGTSFRGCLVGMNIWRPIVEFHHGGCVGADVEAHNVVLKQMESQIIVHPPTEDMFFSGSCYTSFPDRVITLVAKPYLHRNHDIVDACDVLLATPKTLQEVLRSGTWATIRYAKAQGKHVIIIFPNGDCSDGSFPNIGPKII